MFENLVSWHRWAKDFPRTEWEMNLPFCQYGGEFAPSIGYSLGIIIKSDFACFSDSVLAVVCNHYTVETTEYIFDDMDSTIDQEHRTNVHSFDVANEKDVVLAKLAGDETTTLDFDKRPIIFPYEIKFHGHIYSDVSIAAAACIKKYKRELHV